MKLHVHRGYSLLEMATVLAIVGTVAAMSIGGLEYMNKRGSFAAASGGIIGGLRRTQSESYGQGTTTAFVVDTVGGRWWGITTNPYFDVSTFDPSNPGNVIVSDSLPKAGPNGAVTFGPNAGWGSVVASPFNLLPTTSSQTSNTLYCTFCLNTGFGAIIFEPGAPVKFSKTSFSSPTPEFGEQFMVHGTYGKGARTTLVAVVAQTGVIETFEQDK